MPKGFEAWVAALPENKGWGTDTFNEGHYLFADSIVLSVGQEFTDRPDKLVYGRGEKASTRTKGAQKPNGDIEFQFRTNDCVPILMAHFQKHIGTEYGSTGTSEYTFVPEKGQFDWVGSSYGTGSYTSPAGDAFTVGIVEKINDTDTGTDNALWYKNGIVEQLVMTFAAEDDAKMTPSFKFKTVDEGTKITAAYNPNNANFGSYSTLAPFEGFEGTFTVCGRTDLKITNLTVTSVNNSDDRPSLGNLNPTEYDFGKNIVSGVAQIDAPNDSLSHVGSMVADRALAVTGTLFNNANSLMVINMPNCRYEPFDVNPSGANAQTEYGLPFKAYESEDGQTPPITITVKTLGMGSAFNVK